MDRREAFLIVEEILKMMVFTNSHFQENMHEYICDKLDISDESLSEVLDMISKENKDRT